MPAFPPLLPLLALTTLGLAALPATEWTRLADMPLGRGEAANAVVDGKIYVMGGMTGGRTNHPEIQRFDPATGTWATVASMPAQRDHLNLSSAVHGSESWVCGGKSGGGSLSNATNRVDVFDTATGAWRRGPDLPEKHWSGPTVVVGDELHVISGAWDSGSTTRHHFVLDLGNETAGWTTEPQIPYGTLHTAGVVIGSDIYIVAGETSHSGHDGVHARLQRYDTQSDSWQRLADLPRIRSHHEWATFANQGRIWSLSGIEDGGPSGVQREIFVYDPGTDAWSHYGDMPRDLVSPGAKIVAGVLYLYGGGDGGWWTGGLDMVFAHQLDGGSDTTPPAAPTGLTVTVE